MLPIGTDMHKPGWRIVVGPVFAADGAFGMAIIETADARRRRRRSAIADPVLLAGLGFRTEISPMPSVILRPSAAGSIYLTHNDEKSGSEQWPLKSAFPPSASPSARRPSAPGSKKVGDAIKADEPILELETDKVTIEVPAPAAGTLSEIVAQAGETVGLGALLGQISAGNGAACRSGPGCGASPPPPRLQLQPVAAPLLAMPPAPAAAKLLAENNLSADQVDGSGKRGQVLKGDVIAAVAKAASAPAAAPAAPVAVRAPTAVEDAGR